MVYVVADCFNPSGTPERPGLLRLLSKLIAAGEKVLFWFPRSETDRERIVTYLRDYVHSTVASDAVILDDGALIQGFDRYLETLELFPFSEVLLITSAYLSRESLNLAHSGYDTLS